MASTTNYNWTTPDDTDLVKNGASAIRSLGSSVDTALWTAGYSAGKNKIINGDFSINQRNFTSNTADDAYNFDRFLQSNSGGTVTVTPQTFTLGTAPVSGYEAKNYLQAVTASQSAAGDYAQIRQKIESVRTFAGQTATVSFWAKAASGTPAISVMLQQYFGTGGSPSSAVNTVGSSAVTLSTSWARYSVTIAVPSISGKTIGTNNNDALILNLWLSAGSTYASIANSIGIQNNTFSIWGVQLEAGSTATPFQTATGTKQGELAACQRYYFRTSTAQGNTGQSAFGVSTSTTSVRYYSILPVTMRISPSAIEFSSVSVFDLSANTTYAISAVANDVNITSPNVAYFVATCATMTSGRTVGILANAGTGYMGFSAEL